LGVAQCQAYWSGQVRALLHPSFHLFVLWSGLLLVLLAVARVWTQAENRPTGSWRSFGLTLFVVLAVIGSLKVAPQGYSTLAVNNRGVTNELVADFSPPEPFAEVGKMGELIECEVTDLLWAANDAAASQSLTGREVRLIGQYYPEDADGFQVVRLLMFCCAADAQPMGIKVRGATNGLTANAWIEVTGKVFFGRGASQKQVEIELENVRTISPPREIFLY
jgi:uncharacterized repeat protein (TIGR03943 family)